MRPHILFILRRPRAGRPWSSRRPSSESHIGSVADRFAKAGYAAIAPELYHRRASPTLEGKYDDSAPSIALAPATHHRGFAERYPRQSRISARDGGNANSSASVIAWEAGFRFLADASSARRGFLYYGGGGSDGVIDRAADCSAPMLFFWGEKDKRITGEHHQKVAEGMHWFKHFLGAGYVLRCRSRILLRPASQLQSNGRLSCPGI